MPDNPQPTNEEIQMQVSLLARDIQSNVEHTERLDAVIEQLKQLTESITKMIAIHEEKHIQHEKSDKEKRREINALDKRIQETEDKLHRRISSSEQKICDKLDAVKEKLDEDAEKKYDKLDERLSKVEKYVWLALGGGVVIGLLLKVAVAFV